MVSDNDRPAEKEAVGYRLYARAAEINAKLAIKRHEAKIKEEEQTENLFRPRLVSKSTRPDTAKSKGKAFERLYENSKLKQQRDVARKHAHEVQKIQKTPKQHFISPNKATELYDRTIASRQERDKKILQLEASLTPTFSPQLLTDDSNIKSNTRSKSRAKSRPKSRGRGRDSIDRLYAPNYLKERDEKLKRMKEKELEGMTFSPTLKKNLSKFEKQDETQNTGPAWNRLYESTKQTRKAQKSLNENHSFTPDISKSQKLLSPPISTKSDEAKVHERLYKHHELKHSKVPKHIPASDEHELTFHPVINDKKVPTDMTRDERINNLYQRGMKTVGERRSLSLAKEPKKEVKKEEEELTFQPKTNWGRSKNYNAAMADPKEEEEVIAETDDIFKKEMGTLDAALSDLQMNITENNDLKVSVEVSESEDSMMNGVINNEGDDGTSNMPEPVEATEDFSTKDEAPLPQSIETTEMY